MPLSTETPVLTVDPATIANIDPQVPENLFGMWSAFSRCSGIMENGKRFENLYWRVWNHKSLSQRTRKDPRLSHAAKPSSTRHLSTQNTTSVPELSSSVDSLSSRSSSENTTESTPDSSRSSLDKVKTFDSCAPAEKERHLSPIDLVELVVSIQEKQDLTEPFPDLPMPQIQDTTLSPPRSKERGATHDSTPRASSPRRMHNESSPRPVRHESSQSTVATEDSRVSLTDTCSSYTSNLSPHNVIRGFLPGQESSYRSQTQLAPSSPAPIGILKASGGPKSDNPKKKPLFMLGAGSSGEDEGSCDHYLSRPMRSSLSESARRSVDAGSRKQTSFDERVTEITVPSLRPEDNEAVFEDTDDEEVDEGSSAIEEDDEDAWENASDEGDSGPPSEAPEAIFRRVDSGTNLPSRRSMLTLALHEGDRRSTLQNEASRSTPAIRRSRTSTPNGPSIAASPDDDSPLQLRSTPIAAQPKPLRMHSTSAAMSPRTTRRNMLMTEIPEDLRRDLLHERKQRLAKPLNGNLPRRHTSQDIINLNAHPYSELPGGTAQGTENYYFNNGIGEYHVSGW